MLTNSRIQLLIAIESWNKTVSKKVTPTLVQLAGMADLGVTSTAHHLHQLVLARLLEWRWEPRQGIGGRGKARHYFLTQKGLAALASLGVNLATDTEPLAAE